MARSRASTGTKIEAEDGACNSEHRGKRRDRDILDRLRSAFLEREADEGERDQDGRDDNNVRKRCSSVLAPFIHFGRDRNPACGITNFYGLFRLFRQVLFKDFVRRHGDVPDSLLGPEGTYRGGCGLAGATVPAGRATLAACVPIAANGTSGRCTTHGWEARTRLSSQRR